MKKIVYLNEISKVYRFLNDVRTFDCDIDITKGRYIIDAKSQMGIFTLNLSEPINVVIHSDDVKVLERFSYLMEKYECKE